MTRGQIEADHERFDEFLTFLRDSGNRAADADDDGDTGHA